MEYKDYYKILQVDKKATQDEIKRQYRKLAKESHPDLHPDDETAHDRFKELNEAYEVLSDPDKRKKYDQFGSATGGFYNGQNFDPRQYGYTYTTGGNTGGFSDFFDMFFGGQGYSTQAGSYSAGFDLGDLFGGRATGRKTTRPKKQDAYEAELTITLEEAAFGTTKHLSLTEGGETKNIEVKIPKGITDGKKLRVNGKKWGLKGNLLITIHLAEHSRYDFDGKDITLNVNISPWTAALGGQVTVHTLHDTVRLNVPANTRSGQRMRLAGKGFTDMKGKTGDTYVRFVIQNPSHLSEKQRELYEALQKTEA